jgi:hypothetical protein
MTGFVITDKTPGARYNREAVDHAIASHNRYRRAKIGKKEAALIHALLKGRESEQA